MKHNSPSTTDTLYTHIDVGQNAPPSATAEQMEQTRILREIVTSLDRHNELLEELVSVVSAPQRQRAAELSQWKQANPVLARNCRAAAEALSQVQAEFLSTLTQEVRENSDNLTEGDFFLSEFVDRFGPRLAHLNGVLQVLSQLGGNIPQPVTRQKQ